MSKSNQEQEHVRKKPGKWATNEVPHSGWRCVNVQDLGEPSEKCEMCEAQEVRYVHYMRHKDYHTSLAVGCDCAGRMEDDLGAAKARDKEMQREAQRRLNWIKRKWDIAPTGRETYRTKGYLVIIYNNGDHWSQRVRYEGDLSDRLSPQKYETSDEAKLGAYDYIQSHMASKKDGAR